MKVIINKQEYYEAIIPEEVDLRQLDSLVKRLQNIQKVFGKDDIIDNIDIMPKPEKKRQASHKKATESIKRLEQDRNLAKKLFYTYYHSSPKKFDSFIDNNNLRDLVKNRALINGTTLKRIRRLHRISDREVK